MPLRSQDSNDRVMVFIDLANIEMKAHDLRFSVDYCELVKNVVRTRKMVASYVFDSHGEDGCDSFIQSRLRRNGFRMHIRDSYDTNREEQKEVDVAMACNIVAHAFRDNYDVAVIVSGDRDYVPAIEMVQDLGKRVEVASFRGCIGTAMMNAGDQFIDMDTLPILKMDCILTDLSEVIEWSA